MTARTTSLLRLVYQSVNEGRAKLRVSESDRLPAAGTEDSCFGHLFLRFFGRL
ncbi:MAG: hypothetical protein AB7O48_11790 [Cyclobacteriaceae bacterium]